MKRELVGMELPIKQQKDTKKDRHLTTCEETVCAIFEGLPSALLAVYKKAIEQELKKREAAGDVSGAFSLPSSSATLN